MKVLVTGSKGKVGRYTVRELDSQGYEVVHVDIARPEEALPGTFNQADLTNAGEVYDVFHRHRPDMVCHIAANPDPNTFPSMQIYHNNTISTLNVMLAAGDTGVTRFIYAGSEMATGWLTSPKHPEKFPFKEEDRVDSPNTYALSKYSGEIIADSMNVRYPDMDFVTLRINNVILPGSGYDKLKYRRENFPEPGSENYWSYIDVRDVARAFAAALVGKSSGHEVFLIAAADTCIDVPIRKAFRERYGEEGNFDENHGDFDSVFDCSKIKEWFGWEAKYSWRNE